MENNSDFKDVVEKLKLEERILRDTSEWWSKNITNKAQQYDKLCGSKEWSLEKEQKIGQLREEIESLQKKGVWEEKHLKDFVSRKEKIFMNYLISGALALKLNTVDS